MAAAKQMDARRTDCADRTGRASQTNHTSRDVQAGRTKWTSRADQVALLTQDLNELLRYWTARKQDLLPAAGEQFISFVDPAFLYGVPPLIGPDDFSIMFTEWMLFEYIHLTKGTPAELYVSQLAEGIGPDRLARLRQVTTTQLFSRFIIREKDQASGMAVLEDVQTSRRYDVFDPALCANERWSTGTIGERIACVDGLWLPVGLVRLYDRASPETTAIDGPGFFHPEDRSRKPEAEHASFYLRLVRDTIGIDGRYRHTATIPSERMMPSDHTIPSERTTPLDRKVPRHPRTCPGNDG